MSDAGGDDTDRGTADAEATETIVVGVTPRTLGYITMALTLAIGLVAIFRPAEEAVTRIVIGIVLALALDPLVRSLQRRGLGRRSAATIVGLAIVAIAALLVVLVGPPAIEQAQQFEDDLPQTIQEFYELPLVGDWLEENDAAGKIDEFVAEAPSQIDDETVEGTVNSLVGNALGAILVLAVTFAVMLDGEALVGRIRRLIPAGRRDRADHYGRLLYETFGRYFGGSVTVAAMSGLWTLTIALILDVPLAPIAAIWTMVTNVIPQIGGFLGGAFLTVLALSVSVPTAIAAALLFVVYMNFENNVIQPAIIGNAVDLSPPVSMLAVLLGGAAAGIPGALIATPLVGSAKRIFFELRGESRESKPSPSIGDRLRHLFHRDKADA
ncbi:MAG: AI-2E family transporter [Ilumatobacteraceae bacterium]